MKCKLKLPIYECTVHLEVVSETRDVCERVNALAKKNKMEIPNSDKDEAWGETLAAFNNYYIIISKHALNNYNTILHELGHVVEFITQDREIDDSEARAYLHGHLGDYFLQKLRPHLTFF